MVFVTCFFVCRLEIITVVTWIIIGWYSLFLFFNFLSRMNIKRLYIFIGGYFCSVPCSSPTSVFEKLLLLLWLSVSVSVSTIVSCFSLKQKRESGLLKYILTSSSIVILFLLSNISQKRSGSEEQETTSSTLAFIYSLVGLSVKSLTLTLLISCSLFLFWSF